MSERSWWSTLGGNEDIPSKGRLEPPYERTKPNRFFPKTVGFIGSYEDCRAERGRLFGCDCEMVEVRGVEPLCPWPSRAASTCVASDWISPPGRDDARSSFGQPWFEVTAATSRRPSPLFLLSTLLATSRCHGRNVATLSSQGHFFECAVCLF